MEALELKGRLLTDHSRKIGNLQKGVGDEMAELASVKKVLEVKEVALKANVHEFGRLRLDFQTAQAVFGRRERFIHNVDESL